MPIFDFPYIKTLFSSKKYTTLSIMSFNVPFYLHILINVTVRLLKIVSLYIITSIY